MRKIVQLVIVVSIAGLVGCGGGDQTQPVGNYSQDLPEDLQIQYAQEFPGALPQDSVQPWEELGADGKVVPKGNKGVSATNESSEFFAGTQTETESGDTSDWNGALRMGSGDNGAGNLSYAMYRIPLGGSEPGVVSVDANLRPMNDGNLGGYYVGLADYGNNSWQWFGPVTDAHWRISSVQAARESASYTSGLGSVFVCIVAHDGAALDVVGVGIDPFDPADTAAPDAPPAPALTPVAGGLLVDWTTFAGNDIAGYKLYYKNSVYTELTAFSAKTLETLHDSLVRLSLDEYSTGRCWVAISTVDLSGNESTISPVVSATPLASTGSQPPVWIDLDNATALINQPIGMTATGADNYDWDTNGDGVFDVLGDATGTQNIDTSSPGIIRPLVRGNSSDGTFVSLGAVSVIVTSNARPVVQGFVEPAFGVAPLEVQFTSLQVDIDGDVVEWVWDFFGDNSVNFRYSTAGGATDPAPYSFSTPGLYNAKVRVWDDDGAWDVDTVTIMVTGNSPPVAIIASVLECQRGDSISFDAQQSFDLDGTIVNYEWDLDDDAVFNEPGDEADNQGSSEVEHTYPDPGYQPVTVRVTDNGSATATTSVTAIVHGWAEPLVPDANNSVGKHSSLVIVDGNPAISYHNSTNSDLMYVRSTDAGGTNWGAPIAVVTTGLVGSHTSLAIVDGNPAISYLDDTDGDLEYVRATDSSGSSWGLPVEVDATGLVGLFTTLLVVAGNPAIGYWDLGNGDLEYCRALDTSGGTWGTPVDVETLNNVGSYASMAIVDGNPAFSYYDSTNMNLKYVRASDAAGTTWGVTTNLDTIGDVGRNTSLVVVDGFPAVSYFDTTSDNLKFTRAVNASGSSWGTPIVVDYAVTTGAFTSMVIVDGFPTISFYDGTGEDLMCVQASDASGSTWGNPVALDSEGIVGWYPSLAFVDGNAAISYWDWTNDDLKYVRLY